MMSIPKRLEELISELRTANAELEAEILQQLTDIEEKLSCKCGREAGGSFNGMPHCLPGTGCSTNTGTDGCCCCGASNTATFHGENLCPRGLGCNAHNVEEKSNPVSTWTE